MQYSTPTPYASGATAFRDELNADLVLTWTAINNLELQMESALRYLIGSGYVPEQGNELAVTGVGAALFTCATGVALVKGVVVEVSAPITQGTVLGGTNYVYLKQDGTLHVTLVSTAEDDEIPLANAAVDAGGLILTPITTTAVEVTMLLEYGPHWYPFPLPAFVANSTVTTWLWHASGAQTVTGIRLAAATLPIDADGTCLVQVKYWDASANADVNLMDTAFDAETLTAAKEGQAMALTATVANLTLAAGDYIYAEMVNNSAAIGTPWSGAVLTIGIAEPAGT